MTKIQTVTGEVDSETLGFVLPHEHVFMDGYDETVNSGMILNDPIVARDELIAYRNAGGKTLVDQTPYGLHPDPVSLRDMSESSGVVIIAGTGVYWERFHPAWLCEMSEEEIAKLFIRDITIGIAGTDVKAGIIGEIATGHRVISPCEERVLRAAAVAQLETGLPLATHALFTEIGLRQVRCLEKAGAQLDRVVIGHVDTMLSLDYHERLLAEGVWIAYDCIGQKDKVRDEDRADAVIELVKRGHGRRLLLSSDIGYRTNLEYFGGNGYSHVIRNFLPMLVDRGLDESSVRMLTVENPRALLTPAA